MGIESINSAREGRTRRVPVSHLLLAAYLLILGLIYRLALGLGLWQAMDAPAGYLCAFFLIALIAGQALWLLAIITGSILAAVEIAGKAPCLEILKSHIE